LTFEFNPKDELMLKLNEFRKSNPDAASMISRQIFDNCCLEAGLEGDGRSMVKRINTLMSKYLDSQK
jgi:HSP90 family molecular chaperone